MFQWFDCCSIKRNISPLNLQTLKIRENVCYEAVAVICLIVDDFCGFLGISRHIARPGRHKVASSKKGKKE